MPFPRRSEVGNSEVNVMVSMGRGALFVTVLTDRHETYGLSLSLRSWASLSGD
jgi:hypothetical protein